MLTTWKNFCLRSANLLLSVKEIYQTFTEGLKIPAPDPFTVFREGTGRFNPQIQSLAALPLSVFENCQALLLHFACRGEGGDVGLE